MLILSLTTALCLSAFLSNAQHYRWDQYGIGFQVARDFVVEENTSTIFDATSSDGEISIAIEPWLDQNVTMDNVADVILNVAADMKFYDGGDVVGDYVEVHDFVGYYIIAAPINYADFGYDYVALVILLDAESATNMVISIGYNEGNFKEAEAIVDSFYAYD